MPLKSVWSKASNNIFDVPLEEHLRKTGQDHLPQAQLLTNCLKALESEKLAEAYLRGSFSAGDADEYSDIDLFLVVDPKNLASTYGAVVSYLEREHKVLVSCHDKLVVDYGGIGFMFLCKGKDGRLFQFDLYMAMKGLRPKTPLKNCPRIYAKDPAYCWVEETRSKSALPRSARRFIEHHTHGDDKTARVKYYLTDLMVTLNILQKHLKRGQTARALYDNNQAISFCIEMLGVIAEQKGHHWGFYAADQILRNCQKSKNPALQDAANILSQELTIGVNYNKAQALFDVARNLVREAEPALYAAMETSMDEFERLVLKKNRPFSRGIAPDGP